MDRRWFALWLTVMGVLPAAWGHAQGAVALVASELLDGHPVRVERAAAGALALVVSSQERAVWATEGGSAAARFERVAVGAAQVLVVRVTAGADAYGAVVVGAPGREPTIAWQGSLRFHGDDPGEQVASEIVVRDLDGDGAPDIVVGTRRQDVQLCQAGMPLIDARALAPATLRFVPVSLNPLRADLLTVALPALQHVDAAVLREAVPPAIARVRVVAQGLRGVSAGPSDALTDRDPRTSTTLRTHDFVVVSATLAGSLVERIVWTAPPAPAALPARVTVLAGEGGAFDVSIPATPPGRRVSIPIHPARRMRCMAAIVTEGASRGATAIAEVSLGSALEREADPAGALVRMLDSADRDEAAMLLADLGDHGVRALADAMPTLGTPAARAAVRLLGTLRTPAAATALVAALARVDLADDARGALQRMGPPALAALSQIIATDARAAEVLATLRAPIADRLRAFTLALGADAAVWHDVRGAMQMLLHDAATSEGFDEWLTGMPSDVGLASRALSVAAEAAETDAQRAAVARRARGLRAVSFADRYRLLVPLVGDDEGHAQVVAVAQHDENADLRAEAVRALARVHDGLTLQQALGDPTPRVRAQAADGLRGVASARADLTRALQADGWPSVRAAAARALRGDPAAIDALLAGLEDPAPIVVDAAIQALGVAPGSVVSARLMRFAEDGRRSPALRGQALSALAARCDRTMAVRLEGLVLQQVDPMLPPPEQEVGHQAMAALARIDAARARALLARMDANAAAREAVQRATLGVCATGAPGP